MKFGDDLNSIFRRYPGLSIKPTRDEIIRIEGTFEFTATFADRVVSDSFELAIDIPLQFPNDVPIMKETGGKIPKTDAYHVNPDKTLCLGSVLGLRKSIHDNPTLLAFVEGPLVAYCFNVSIKLCEGGPFITGELEHGNPGLLTDYAIRFGLSHPTQVYSGLTALAQKRRIANKRNCPCECGRRLGVCPTHLRLNQYRRVAARSWFARHASYISA